MINLRTNNQGVNNSHSFFLNLTAVVLASSQEFRHIGYGPLTAISETVEQNGSDPNVRRNTRDTNGKGWVKVNQNLV